MNQFVIFDVTVFETKYKTPDKGYESAQSYLRKTFPWPLRFWRKAPRFVHMNHAPGIPIFSLLSLTSFFDILDTFTRNHSCNNKNKKKNR